MRAITTGQKKKSSNGKKVEGQKAGAGLNEIMVTSGKLNLVTKDWASKRK